MNRIFCRARKVFEQKDQNINLLPYIRIMIYKVARFIEEKALLPQGAKVLVALSGGADSVALLLVLNKLGYKCEAIHCNFHLRGEESMRDEKFVRDLCERYNTPLKVVNFDTTGYAAEKKISIEMAARELRYDAFEKQRKESQAVAVAVAHHRNDSAETLLLNLIRGTGIKGLHGIQCKKGNIVRPLLCASREEITDYLKWRGEGYVTDSTNLTTDFTRNKIRLSILPLMKEINPAAMESIALTAERVSESEKVYAKAIEEGVSRVKKGNEIDIELLKREVSPQALLFEILHPLGFNGAQIKEIATAMDSESGTTFACAAWKVVKDRHTFIIAPAGNETMQPTALLPGSEAVTPFGTIKCTQHPFDGTIKKEKRFATIDCSKVQLPLTIRLWKQGDRFAPFGMRGTKLVSDYMTDRKMSLINKERQCVVTDEKGNIIWLVGERPAAHCSTNSNTENVICLEWIAKPI